jgi:hypothetical protein
MTYVDKLWRAARPYLAKPSQSWHPLPLRERTHPHHHALQAETRAEILAEQDLMRKKVEILAMRLHSGKSWARVDGGVRSFTSAPPEITGIDADSKSKV